MTEKQFKEITEWQKETFGQSTAFSILKHLEEEVNELIIDVSIDGLGKRLEFADCLLLLFGAASADGMSYQDICDCVDEKMVINRNRNWGKPDENGVVKHIKKGLD